MSPNRHSHEAFGVFFFWRTSARVMVPVAYRAQNQTYVRRSTARTNVARAIEDGRSMLLFMRPYTSSLRPHSLVA
jgi:hypothetical protein